MYVCERCDVAGCGMRATAESRSCSVLVAKFCQTPGTAVTGPFCAKLAGGRSVSSGPCRGGRWTCVAPAVPCSGSAPLNVNVKASEPDNECTGSSLPRHRTHDGDTIGEG